MGQSYATDDAQAANLRFRSRAHPEESPPRIRRRSRHPPRIAATRSAERRAIRRQHPRSKNAGESRKCAGNASAPSRGRSRSANREQCAEFRRPEHRAIGFRYSFTENAGRLKQRPHRAHARRTKRRGSSSFHRQCRAGKCGDNSRDRPLRLRRVSSEDALSRQQLIRQRAHRAHAKSFRRRWSSPCNSRHRFRRRFQPSPSCLSFRESRAAVSQHRDSKRQSQRAPLRISWRHESRRSRRRAEWHSKWSGK